MRRVLAAALLFASLPLAAADRLPLTSHGLLTQLQAFMQGRGVEPEDLTPDDLVSLMIDWYRFARMGEPAPAADALVFRYGGWSEGCATAFNLSVLRRVRAPDGEADLVAGITMMFEPSGAGELKPYSSATSDWESTEEFVLAVEQSPAFKLLSGTKPMSVLLESGALR
jgi:hypothetical protein